MLLPWTSALCFSVRGGGMIRAQSIPRGPDPDPDPDPDPSLLPEVQMFICNREVYGFLPVPLRSHSTLQDEAESFLHVLLEIMGEPGPPPAP